MPERDLYPIVSKFLKERLGCFHVAGPVGTRYGLFLDSDTINEICVPPFFASAYISREKAERLRRDGWETKPTDIRPNSQRRTHWEQWYKRFWEWKLAHTYEQYR